ncbi:selenocysteine-specific elongation factor [Anopheles aquasalis]|uniref:selenocysteine-specific elongation factor n=1 Tax=Anopheles aquasalis TaxID=42839 RepID=UPI00215A4752|nr:selenocysteine-specific elongation factor [Anopheles aquasalis]XP_050090156.1 selenocysteine-specific elongation factor [Anopheles aquasalis]
MYLNLNVGILGHVDSGKTTLARALSAIASTAAFDKNPQSQERGITLDLGFSAAQFELPDHLQGLGYERLQFTFVDCPGHASLIRTIIGGAQIIDLMLLVIDAEKGIQPQTAECLIIGELTCRKMIVVLNKLDSLADAERRGKRLEKLTKGIRETLSKMAFDETPIVAISALSGENIPTLTKTMLQRAFLPARNVDLPLMFAVDHCFAIKGQGTVCTGTVLQGTVNVGDKVEIPKLKLQRKVRSIQMFRQSYTTIRQGDRAGICITQFDPKSLERGIVCAADYAHYVYAAIVKITPLRYYKRPIRSKAKFHITCGYETVLATILLFTADRNDPFTYDRQYEFLEELTVETIATRTVFALLEFEKPILTTPEALIIGSKLDSDIQHNTDCRIAFHGHLDGLTMREPSYAETILPGLQVFKQKCKTGTIQRIVNDQELIVAGLFKKTGSNRQVFIGLTVTLSSGDRGVIDDTFGAGGKVKLRFQQPIAADVLERLNPKATAKREDLQVELKFKKFLFERTGKEKKIIQ